MARPLHAAHTTHRYEEVLELMIVKRLFLAAVAKAPRLSICKPTATGPENTGDASRYEQRTEEQLLTNAGPAITGPADTGASVCTSGRDDQSWQASRVTLGNGHSGGTLM